MDPDTERLVLQLHLEDIGFIVAEIDEYDENSVYRLIQQEFEARLEIVEDQCFSLSLLRAESAERATFNDLLREEHQAVQDHEIACHLSGMIVTSEDSYQRVSSVAPITTEEANDFADFTQPTTSINFAYNSDSEGERGESSSAPSYKRSADKGKGKAKETHAECVACTESKPTFDILQLNCQPEPHAYCRDCLVGLFESSMTDTSLFPPRCCRVPISLVDCEPFLAPSFVERFVEKRYELSTPNPTYCSDPACGRFIRKAFYKHDVAKCPNCTRETCTRCNDGAHEGLCPEDPTTQPFWETATESQWRQCSSCKIMVELMYGCNHITCRCGAEFCYICGTKWRSCSCPQFEEQGLMQQARRRSFAAPAAPPPPSPPPVRVPLEALFAAPRDDNCNHAWHRHYHHDGANTTCEMCVNESPLRFIEVCTACGRRMCLRCINNRV